MMRPITAMTLLPVLILMSAAAATQNGLTAPNVAHADITDVYAVEGGIEIRISYPESLVAGRDGTVSILVKNNGWEDKQDISFAISSSDVKSILAGPSDVLEISRLAEGGAHGQSIRLHAAEDANPGTHYLNLHYMHVLVADNEMPQEPFSYDVAVPIIIKGDAGIDIRTQTPESIFTNAEFPITVEVSSEDADIRDVRIKTVPPSGIEFRGETMHTFSKIERGVPVSITSVIVTPAREVTTEHRLPFEIIVEYVNDVGEEKADSQTVSVTLRPRTFMELTMDGGVWIGGVFLAPYVSIGTIVGVPAGAIISLLLRKRLGGSTQARKKKIPKGR